MCGEDGTATPQNMVESEEDDRSDRLEVMWHRGFEDYRAKVLELAPEMDGIILGAAVANLIPAKTIVGKFPSHNYKPGDVVPIDFKIAPRVIDEVKAAAPNAHLFGFKLLDGVPHEELIRAAYGIVLEAKATAVIANDARKLQQKFVVTKERGVHPMEQEDLATWIWEALKDEYYSTEVLRTLKVPTAEADRVRELVGRWHDHFTTVEQGLIFGTVAVRAHRGFVTTGRGKRELDSIAYVWGVDHVNRRVSVSHEGKASLNAPLLAAVFGNQDVDHIVHYHYQIDGLPTYDYAPPGTVRDSMRPTHTSFNIKEHGCMLLFSADGRQL